MSERKNWLTDEKHKELSDKYEHYVCDICSEIGAQLVISEFVNDYNEILDTLNGIMFQLGFHGINIASSLDGKWKDYKLKKEKWEEKVK